MLDGWNHNLLATCVYRVSASLASGVWDFSIGATYLYFLSGHSNKVGIGRTFWPLKTHIGYLNPHMMAKHKPALAFRRLVSG